MEILWPVVFGGLFGVAFGISTIVLRDKLARFFVQLHRGTFGERTARIQRVTTSRSLIAPGVFGIVIGVVAIAMAVFAPGAF